MKKTLTVLLAATLLFALAACGESRAEIEAREAHALGQEAFDALVAAVAPTESAMNTIHRAWNWAVTDSRRGSGGSQIWRFDEYLLATGLDRTAVLNAADPHDNVVFGFRPSQGDFMMRVDFNDTIFVTRLVLADAGVYDTVQAYVETANGAIRRLSTEFSDYAHLQALTDFYIAVSGALEWAQSPSGSLSTAGGIIRDFEADMRMAQTQLNFVFD